MSKKKETKDEFFGALGWIKDPSDHRDQSYATIRQIKDSQLPDKIELRNLLSKVEDQGQMSSCVACAIVGALEFLQLKAKKKVIQDMSKMFVYYNSRMIDHLENMDIGCVPRSAIKSIVDYGVCRENIWKYVYGNLFKKPTKFKYWLAKKKIVKDYYRIAVPEPNLIKAALAEGYPVIFGTVIFDSFGKIKSDGIVPLPDTTKERARGGHAMLICGYNDKYFVVRNSWGTSWGDKGYCYFPIEYFAKLPSISFDFWVIRQQLGV